MTYYSRLLSVFILIILASGCKKDELPSADSLIANYSFEENGVYSTSGWTTNATDFSTLVPENGGDFSIKISPAIFPEIGFADFVVTNLTGNKTINANCKMNAFGGWIGKVELLQQIDAEVTNIIASFESSENSWQDVNLSANATFETGQVLTLRLSAGSTTTPLPLQFILFDIIELEIN